MTDATESIVRFGPGENLLGIVTPAPQPVPGAPVCLLFNAGVVHRIGPHRLNVKLARALAARGFTAFRMDLSGLGDSPVSADAATVNSSDQAMADLRAAMDHIERTEGVNRFVLFGLCSGARHGYRLAQIEPRIVALLMFDGYVFPTTKTQILRRVKRFRASPWSEIARKPIDWVLRRNRAKPATAVPSGEPEHPTPAQFQAAMDAVVARGTAVWTMHSGSFVGYFNYADQWRDMFRGAAFMRDFRQDYLPRARSHAEFRAGAARADRPRGRLGSGLVRHVHRQQGQLHVGRRVAAVQHAVCGRRRCGSRGRCRRRC